MDLLHTSYPKSLGVSSEFDPLGRASETDLHGYKTNYYGAHAYTSHLNNLYRNDYQNTLNAFEQGMLYFLFLINLLLVQNFSNKYIHFSST